MIRICRTVGDPTICTVKGAAENLRTVTAFYPVVANDLRSGLVRSIRHEDGTLDLYDYELASNLWTRTITHLHEQSPSPVSGKTTRDITITNSRGEILEQKTDAYIDGVWYTIARNQMTYNTTGKRITSENLAGQVTTTAWDCCHKVAETGPDGSTTTWDYDVEGRMIASSRLIPLDMTNVTWLTTCYEYDDIGRQIATWQTNFAAQVGLPVERTRYDQLGRTISRLDSLGNSTQTSYSIDGRTVSVLHPNTSTTSYTRSASGDTLSVTGTDVTPEFHTYGILPDGTRWSRTVQGETANSPRFTKRYENLLGQTIRSERSGFQGAVLATVHSYDCLGRLVSTSADFEPTTEYTYDTLGNRIATTRSVGASVPACPPSADTQWRKTETLSSFVLDGETIWLTQTNTISCSDATIAPLVSSSARQLTGLTAALPARSRSTDIRGNVTENQLNVSVPVVTSSQIVPYATNRPLTISRYGVELQTVSVSAVTNTVTCDSLGRQIAHTDGRGNTRHVEYNALGQRSASIDALDNRTSFAYDQFGNIASVTDPLGNATVYEYDLRGNKTYEGGATYPVRYTYDVFGNKTTMTTYRDETGRTGVSPVQGDVTTWLYDIASGAMTNKVYADGKGPTYSYTPDGKLAQRTWARGIVTDYSYDNWGSLTNTVYSDDTPTISLTYDTLGRQIEAHDAAGITTFLYDSFGSVTNETVIGVAGTNTIIRHWDNYGRSLGYSLVGRDDPIAPNRQSTLAYDPSTGRLSSMQVPDPNTQTPQTLKHFTWSYLPGSDLKSSLAYPNGLTAAWTYDANNQLLQVCNSFPTNIISQYDYTYDAAGRRVQITRSGSAMSETRTDVYGYNARSELISAAKSGGSQSSATEYAYSYDDIGNRITSLDLGTNRVYSANELNQYSSITTLTSDVGLQASCFESQFDDDGNQTLIQTSTGIWQVQYNGENRPILWECGSTNISMSYDRMGRRVAKNDRRFVYDGYLQIADNFGNSYVWDCTEPVATRPLSWLAGDDTRYYTHDGNKNVSEVMAFDGVAHAHYDCAPFGAVTSASSLANINPFRFSSEYVEDDLGLVYYNYRHYDPREGRWLSRDPIEENGGIGLYAWCHNGLAIDCLGEEEVQIGKILLNPHFVYRRTVNPGYWESYDKYLAYDTYEYTLTYNKSCDSFKHAYLWVTGVSGDYLNAIDDIGIDIGWKFVSVGISRVYTVEWVSDSPQGNEDGTCVTVSVRIYVYKLSGLSAGGNIGVGKNGSVGSSVGPLSAKTQIGYQQVTLPEHCCCDKKK